MSNNKQSSVDAYCNSCDAFICDELITFEETCSNCGTDIEYFENEMNNNKQSSNHIPDVGKKVSSVDWIVRWFIDNPEATHEESNKAHQQAKAIHKEEIVNAVDGFPIHARNLNGEEYYNETYGNTNSN